MPDEEKCPHGVVGGCKSLNACCRHPCEDHYWPGGNCGESQPMANDECFCKGWLETRIYIRGIEPTEVPAFGTVFGTVPRQPPERDLLVRAQSATTQPSDALSNSMVIASEGHPLVIEHTRVMATLEALESILETAEKEAKTALENTVKYRWQAEQSLSSTIALIVSARKILREVAES